MMIKIGVVVLILAALSATDAFKIVKQCTYESLDGGEEVENCGDEGNGTIVVRVDGNIDQTILFDNDTMEVFQYPNSSNCYVVHHADFPDGFSGELEKDQCQEEADDELSDAVQELASECTGTVLSLRDCTEDHEDEARRKRGCITYYLCRYYYRFFTLYGRSYYRRYTICYFRTRCYGK